MNHSILVAEIVRRLPALASDCPQNAETVLTKIIGDHCDECVGLELEKLSYPDETSEQKSFRLNVDNQLIQSAIARRCFDLEE